MWSAHGEKTWLQAAKRATSLTDPAYACVVPAAGIELLERDFTSSALASKEVIYVHSSFDVSEGKHVAGSGRVSDM